MPKRWLDSNTKWQLQWSWGCDRLHIEIWGKSVDVDPDTRSVQEKDSEATVQVCLWESAHNIHLFTEEIQRQSIAAVQDQLHISHHKAWKVRIAARHRLDDIPVYIDWFNWRIHRSIIELVASTRPFYAHEDVSSRIDSARKFVDLCFRNEDEALEYAVKNEMWVYALLLPKRNKEVVARFLVHNLWSLTYSVFIGCTECSVLSS